MGAPTPTPGPTVMVRHLCRMNGIAHDMWCLWADTFCAYDFGVSYWSNNGYGDWIFGVEGCYLSQVAETQQSTISGGYEIAFLFWTGEVVVFGQDCDWATIRYNVSDILTYQQEYKIGVDLKDEAMKIYID